MGKLHLNLSVIETSLLDVQRDFNHISTTLDTPRDPLNDAVLGGLMAGYEYLNSLLAADLDLLARGHSHHLLELNHLVLCGTDDARYEDCARHLEETERRFYDDRNLGGVRSPMGYICLPRQGADLRQVLDRKNGVEQPNHCGYLDNICF